MMLKVGLTGNIGSGKSTVVKIFSILGIPVFHADYEAKLLYRDEEVKKAVKKHFGDQILNAQNEVDFKLLAQVVFNDPESLRQINTIIHPLVFNRYNEWLKLHQAYSYTIHEAAVIFENQLEHHYDLIINVTAPSEVRMKRVMQRDNVTSEQFYARAGKQLPDNEKNNRSDRIIYNDGQQFLIPQIMNIHNDLIKR
jgi:dephospho-CoA kinase